MPLWLMYIIASALISLVSRLNNIPLFIYLILSVHLSIGTWVASTSAAAVKSEARDQGAMLPCDLRSLWTPTPAQEFLFPALGFLLKKAMPICFLSEMPRYLPEWCNTEQRRNDCGLANCKSGLPNVHFPPKYNLNMLLTAPGIRISPGYENVDEILMEALGCVSPVINTLPLAPLPTK